MAYETGTALSPIDLIGKLKYFVESNGWTVNRYQDEGTGKNLSISKNGLYFNFRALQNEKNPIDGGRTGIYGLLCCPSLGFDNSKTWSKQPGYPKDLTYSNNDFLYSGISLPDTAISAYHFISGDKYLYIITEIVVGSFQYMLCGSLVKSGNYVGGEFMTATFPGDGMAKPSDYQLSRYSPPPFTNCYLSSPLGADWGNGYVRAKIDNQPEDRWGTYPFWGNQGSNSGFTGIWALPPWAGIDRNVVNLPVYQFFFADRTTTYGTSPQTHISVSSTNPIGCYSLYNGLAPLLPIYLYATRDPQTNYDSWSSQNTVFSLLGYLPDIFFCYMKNIGPGSLINFGEDRYIVFPMGRKADYPNPGTGNNGFAIKIA